MKKILEVLVISETVCILICLSLHAIPTDKAIKMGELMNWKYKLILVER